MRGGAGGGAVHGGGVHVGGGDAAGAGAEEEEALPGRPPDSALGKNRPSVEVVTVEVRCGGSVAVPRASPLPGVRGR
ncbi:hypothetical protein ACWC9T_22475 [Kitasatospora sp. NPDC001159]